MTPAPAPDAAGAAADAVTPPACPCGGEMWFLPFGYESWVCRRNPRHWFRPHAERWSQVAQHFVDRTADVADAAADAAGAVAALLVWAGLRSIARGAPRS